MKLTDRAVLVTGGSSGIGFELARRLLSRGNQVMITGRDQNRLEQAQSALPGLLIAVSDVGRPDDIATLRDSVLSRMPDLDILINNAGIMRNIDLRDQRPLKVLTEELDVNLAGPIRMVQAFLPHLLGRARAGIVNVTSALAFVPFTPAPVYSAAKAGLHAYTRTLRVQLQSTNVEVVELAPPGTDTALYHGEFGAELEGVKPMDLSALADASVRALEKGVREIRPGLSNVLNAMSRIAPEFALKQLDRSTRR